MPAQVKPVPETAPPPPAPRTSVPGLFGEWIRQGAEGFIATQKILLDLAAQQNALALTIFRDRLGMFNLTPSNKLVELAAKGLENFMEANKVLLDLAARQNAIVAEGLKPGLAGTPVEGMAEIVRQGVDNLIAAQKRFIDLAEAETKSAVAEYKRDHKVSPAHLTELARDGMKNFLDSQKKFIDIVEHQMSGKKEPAKPGKPADLYELAKAGIDTFVDAQKHLLDLASNQIDVNVKFVREAITGGMGAKQEPTSLTELMRKSTDSFVAAQKALVELASKPRKTDGAQLVEVGTH